MLGRPLLGKFLKFFRSANPTIKDFSIIRLKLKLLSALFQLKMMRNKNFIEGGDR